MKRGGDPIATEKGPRRIALLGATGTIGGTTAAELTQRGHEVVCPSRSEIANPDALAGILSANRCDTLISCMASRTGTPRDAWAVDHDLHVAALDAAKAAGVEHVVLLSAICVQKPRLAFQRAKLAFEAKLMASGLDWTIVRPTAYFKSLSGQLDRLRRGKPFLLFGDGRLTACKPISDRDLADYLVLCIEDPAMRGRILPIGGPGPAITPREQGEELFRLLGKEPKFRSVSPALLTRVATALDIAGTLIPSLKTKAELARIGHYYATESMLVWDAAAGRYDADATPAFGTDTLFDHYRRLVAEGRSDSRGDHAVF